MRAEEPDESEKALDDLESEEGNDAPLTEKDPMIEEDADPLDTEVEDADLFVGDGDDEPA